MTDKHIQAEKYELSLNFEFQERGKVNIHAMLWMEGQPVMGDLSMTFVRMHAAQNLLNRIGEDGDIVPASEITLPEEDREKIEVID